MATHPELSGYRDVTAEATAPAEFPRDETRLTPEEIDQVVQQSIKSTPGLDHESLRLLRPEDSLRQSGVLGLAKVEGVNMPFAILAGGEPRNVEYKVSSKSSLTVPGASLDLPKWFMRSVNDRDVSQFELGTRTMESLLESFKTLRSQDLLRGYLEVLQDPKTKTEEFVKRGREDRIRREREARSQPVKVA